MFNVEFNPNYYIVRKHAYFTSMYYNSNYKSRFKFYMSKDSVFDMKSNDKKIEKVIENEKMYKD